MGASAAQFTSRVATGAATSGLLALRLVYFLSFTIPLLNPAIGGAAIYFYVWLPFLDFEFVHVMGTVRFPRSHILAIGGTAVAFLLAMHDAEFAVRVLIMVIQVSYLAFLIHRRLNKWLEITLFAHMCIALLQLVFFFAPGGLPVLLTPTGITEAIWGKDLAPATFTNFGVELFLPRVSGLHRESGFFSSYIVSLYLCFSASGYLQRRRYLYPVLIVGIILSFSKITLSILVIILVRRLSRLIDRIPLWLTVGMLFAFGVAASGYLLHFLQDSALMQTGDGVSLTHRFFAFYTLRYLDLTDLLWGIYTPWASDLGNEHQALAAFILDQVPTLREYNLYSGLAGIAVKGGIISLALFTLLLTQLRVRSSTFVIVFLVTFSAGIDALQNFVVLAWYFACLCGTRSREAPPQPAFSLTAAPVYLRPA